MHKWGAGKILQIEKIENNCRLHWITPDTGKHICITLLVIFR